MKKDNSKLIKVIVTAVSMLAIVILNAFGDAKRDNGNKRLQKSIEIIRDFCFFLMIGILTGNLTMFVCFGISHLGLRITFTNLIYNLTRKPKLPWYFVGTTSKSDDIESKMSKFWVIFGRVFCLLMAGLCFWLGVR